MIALYVVDYTIQVRIPEKEIGPAILTAMALDMDGNPLEHYRAALIDGGCKPGTTVATARGVILSLSSSLQTG